ncbi:hypothetical protein VIGAN_04420100 [Vigna angularis var. angularis]|uniref:Uncharacterized protein n=1 Tax=Vigna angularis var. angularis TaxID=157739 RepID=A0A0S3S143_PHAAN|nr:uncharacterized protein LOC108329156 isoform X3 [Vigna angularis]BAT86535.1 hypothetical protein VIGAN_04420100 [Vigna angularis var. angularis]
MEELRKLEKVQRMLEFMESRGVSNSNHHSNRFLANFIIFMIQPCGDLAINDKCSVLSLFIPTLSSSFLEDAYQHHHFTTTSEQSSEDKMTVGELEALSVLTTLSRPFSSHQIINWLEHDDFNSRVFEIMGKKGPVRNWFKAIDNGKAGIGRPGQSSGTTQPPLPPPNVRSSSPDEVAIVEEQPLIRKRRGKAVDKTGAGPKRMKEVDEGTNRPLPNGMWDPSFNLSHKIDFNLDDSEKKVVESMTEQQMADAMLELASRAAMAAWHMAYASDRGVLRVELQKAQTQLKELADVHSNCEQRQKQSEQLLSEAQALLNNVQTAGFAMKRERDQLQRERDQLATELEQSTKTVAALTKERDGLLLAAAEEQEIREEMSEAIVVEHTRGFKKGRASPSSVH